MARQNGDDGELESLLTPDEVCALLKIKKQRLYEWVHYKRIPFIKVNGRFLRFSAEKLKVWIASQSSDIIRDDEPRIG